MCCIGILSCLSHFVTVIISSVIWPYTTFLLAAFAISPKYFVAFLKSPKYFGHFFVSPFFHHFIFFITKFLFISLSPKFIFWTKCVAKRPLNHQFSAYITKILWTKDESSNCRENNNKQTKMTRQKMEDAQHLLSNYGNQ